MMNTTQEGRMTQCEHVITSATCDTCLRVWVDVLDALRKVRA